MFEKQCCPECGQNVSLTFKGNLRRHYLYGNVDRCFGGGQSISQAEDKAVTSRYIDTYARPAFNHLTWITPSSPPEMLNELDSLRGI